MGEPTPPAAPVFMPVFRLDLPHGRCVGVALPARDALDEALPPAVLGALLDEERQHVEALPAPRRASWAGGRIALRAALTDLGLDVEVGAILSTARGAPRLPDGVRGSISHKQHLAVGLAAAVVAPAAGGAGAWHLGVDIERVAATSVDITRHVLRPEEIDRLPPEGDPRRIEALSFAFSAKEAIYKALDPFIERYVSFQEVAVERRDDGTAAVGLFLRALEANAAFDVDVRWLRQGDFVITTARVRR